jgi:hypothetical protein
MRATYLPRTRLILITIAFELFSLNIVKSLLTFDKPGRNAVKRDNVTRVFAFGFHRPHTELLRAHLPVRTSSGKAASKVKDSGNDNSLATGPDACQQKVICPNLLNTRR